MITPATIAAGGVALLAVLSTVYYRNKYKALKKGLGKPLTEVVEKGGDDGLVVFDIHDQDVDFKFIPTLNREKGLYFEEKDGKKRYLKVLKKEIHFIRGRFPAVFRVNDKIRAVDIEIIKTLGLMSPAKRAQLLADWSRYTALKDELADLEEEVRFADENNRRAIFKRMEEVEKELNELKQKWGVIFAELDANQAVAWLDGEEGKIHIIRTLNLPEFVDFMTGIHDDDIEDIVREKLNRKLEGILRDISEKIGNFKIPDEEPAGGDWVTKGIVIFFMVLLGIFFLGVVGRALGG